MGSSLCIGDTAPDFTLPDQQGKPVSLNQLLTLGPVVVFFYPKDGTPGCTQQMCEFGLQYSQFKALGASVIGISSDSEQRHAKAHQQHHLPFPLLSDAHGHVRRQWGVPRFLGLLPHRVTYTVAANSTAKGTTNGTIAHRTVALFNIQQHLSEARHALQSLAASSGF